MLIRGLAKISLMALGLSAGAHADFKMPTNPLSPEQTDCMKKELSKNMKPSGKQLADATKTCAAVKSAAKPAPPTPPAPKAIAPTKPAEPESED